MYTCIISKGGQCEHTVSGVINLTMLEKAMEEMKLSSLFILFFVRNFCSVNVFTVFENSGRSKISTKPTLLKNLNHHV